MKLSWMLVRRAGAVAAIAATGLALGGCGSDGAGATGGEGATQTAAGAGGGTSRIDVVVSAAVPVSGNGPVSGTTVVDTAGVGTARTLVADGLGAGGLAHRMRIDYDSVSGVVLAVTHGWGSGNGTFDASAGCVRVVTPAVPTLCAGVTLDVAGRRVSFANTLLRGSGAFTSLLNGTIAFQAP